MFWLKAVIANFSTFKPISTFGRMQHYLNYLFLLFNDRIVIRCNSLLLLEKSKMRTPISPFVRCVKTFSYQHALCYERTTDDLHYVPIGGNTHRPATSWSRGTAVFYVFIYFIIFIFVLLFYIYKTDFHLKLILIETQRETRIWHWPTYSVIKTFINELTHPVIKLIRCVTTSQDVKNTMVQHHLSLSRRNWI